MGLLILVPAYGRQYPNKSYALYDWQNGKDFRIEGGPYTSIRDIDELRKQFGTISIRWDKGLYIQV